MQTEEKMTQQVSVLDINKDSNANKLDLQVLGRFWENSALICYREVTSKTILLFLIKFYFTVKPFICIHR